MIRKIIFAIACAGFVHHASAQVSIYNENNYGGTAQTLDFGHHVLAEKDIKAIKSLKLDEGTVLVLFERYSGGRISGRHKLVTASTNHLEIGFNTAYAVVFQNPENKVMGFAEPNFSGESMFFEKGKNIVPENFGLTSIYIPEGTQLKLYVNNPEDYPGQEIEHRPMGPGIRPFIGADINDKVRYIVIQ